MTTTASVCVTLNSSQWFSNFSMYQNHPEGLLKQEFANQFLIQKV